MDKFLKHFEDILLPTDKVIYRYMRKGHTAYNKYMKRISFQEFIDLMNIPDNNGIPLKLKEFIYKYMRPGYPWYKKFIKMNLKYYIGVSFYHKAFEEELPVIMKRNLTTVITWLKYDIENLLNINLCKENIFEYIWVFYLTAYFYINNDGVMEYVSIYNIFTTYSKKQNNLDIFFAKAQLIPDDNIIRLFEKGDLI